MHKIINKVECRHIIFYTLAGTLDKFTTSQQRPHLNTNMIERVRCLRSLLSTTIPDERVGRHNMRSLANKVDNLLDVCRDQLIDVLFLTDADSICLRRLCAAGFQVVDRPQKCLCTDTLITNHGGIVVLASSGLRLSMMDLGVIPSTFELLYVHIVPGSSSFIAATIHRPGSAVTSALFFTEMSDVLDRLATFFEPILLTGDINICLERLTNSDTEQFIYIFAVRGLEHCVTSATHKLS